MHGSDAEAIHSPNGLVSTDAGAVAAQLDLEFEQRSRGVLHGAGGVTEVELPTTIVKRDGRVVPFDPMRIERAEQRFTITGDCDFALRREYRAVRVNDRGSQLGAADVDSQRGCLRHSSAEYRDLPRTHPLDGALLALASAGAGSRR